MPVCFPIKWWECWSGSGAAEFELSVIKDGVPWKLSGSELWKEGDELTILKKWFLAYVLEGSSSLAIELKTASFGFILACQRGSSSISILLFVGDSGVY